MKNNQREKRHDGNYHEQSNRKSYDDLNVLEPSPDTDFQFLGDDDDELVDYSLMKIANDQDTDLYVI